MALAGELDDFLAPVEIRGEFLVNPARGTQKEKQIRRFLRQRVLDQIVRSGPARIEQPDRSAGAVGKILPRDMLRLLLMQRYDLGVEERVDEMRLARASLAKQDDTRHALEAETVSSRV